MRVTAACMAGMVTALLVVRGAGAAWTPDPAGPTGIDVYSSALYNGQLIVGTAGGLGISDGSEWRYQAHPEGDSAWQLAVAGNTLYILTPTELWTYNGSTMTQLSPDTLSEPVVAFDVDVTTGTVYLATYTQVVILDGGTPTVISTPEEVDNYGIAVHDGVIVTRGYYNGDLSVYEGEAWRALDSSLSFPWLTTMYLGPHGLFIANSSGTMPIDLSSGEPTADAQACYRYADVQWSRDKRRVFLSGTASDPPVMVTPAGRWQQVPDDQLRDPALLVSDGTIHYLAADDFVVVIDSAERRQIGAAAPLPFLYELVAHRQSLVACGPDTVWMRSQGRPWRPILTDFTCTSITPGAGDDLWIAGSGGFVHVAGDGSSESESYYYDSSTRQYLWGDDPIVFALGSLWTFTDSGLYLRTGTRQWRLWADYSDLVDRVYNLWGGDPPIVYESPITGETTIGAVVRTSDGEVNLLYVVIDGGRWGLLPLLDGYQYLRYPVVWNGQLSCAFCNTSPDSMAVAVWNEADWQWDAVPMTGLPSTSQPRDLIATASGLIAIVSPAGNDRSFSTYTLSGNRWTLTGDGVSWGPGAGSYSSHWRMLYAIGWYPGPVLRMTLGGSAVDLSWSPMLPEAGERVSFFDTSLGTSGTNVSWSFGDGATSSERNPIHTYADAGSYPVTISVGTSSFTAEIQVSPSNRRPRPRRPSARRSP